jgi:CheY-like chemotaxis protein/anti-sigma regulatory factor (Ser/Thr protein kinase)
VQRRAIPVRQLFEAMDVQFRAAAELKGLTLDIDPTPVVIESDRAQLERILANFVSNAIRYTREGSVRLRAVEDGEFAVLSVRDTGAGIAPEDREAIFEEFVQLGNPERDRNKGLGLGLAIVRRLADLLGHSVALDSAPGRGSEFAVRVPRVRVDAAFEAAEPQTQPPTADAGQLPGSFVLVIDDERDVLDAMTIVLEQAGAYVLTAGSGAEAVEKISREDRLPDVVVSDLRLRGGETGILAVSRVREAIGEPVPALLVTGDTAPERVAEAAASGLVLLHKPLRPERLTAALSLALAST